MNGFYDNNGRRWELLLDEGARERFAANGIAAADFCRLEGEAFADLAGRAFWLLCQPQAEARGCSPEAFARIVKNHHGQAFAAFRRAIKPLLTTR